MQHWTDIISSLIQQSPKRHLTCTTLKSMSNNLLIDSLSYGTPYDRVFMSVFLSNIIKDFEKVWFEHRHYSNSRQSATSWKGFSCERAFSPEMAHLRLQEAMDLRGLLYRLKMSDISPKQAIAEPEKGRTSSCTGEIISLSFSFSTTLLTINEYLHSAGIKRYLGVENKRPWKKCFSSYVHAYGGAASFQNRALYFNCWNTNLCRCSLILQLVWCTVLT